MFEERVERETDKMAAEEEREGHLHLGNLVDNFDDMMGKTRKKFCKLHHGGFYYYASKLAAGNSGVGGYDNFFLFSDIADIIKTDIKIKAKDAEGKWGEVTKHGFVLDLWVGKKLPVICLDEKQREFWVAEIQREIDHLTSQCVSVENLSSDEEDDIDDKKGKGKKKNKGLGGSFAGKLAGSKMGKKALKEFARPDVIKLLDIYEETMDVYQKLTRGPPPIKTRTPVLDAVKYKRWVIKIGVRAGVAAREKKITEQQFWSVAPALKVLWSDIVDYLEMPSLVDPPVVYERLQNLQKDVTTILSPVLTKSSLVKLDLIFRVMDVRFLGYFFDNPVFAEIRMDLAKQLRVLWDKAFPPVKRRFLFKKKKTVWQKSDKEAEKQSKKP